MTDTAIEWTRGPDGRKGKAWNTTTGCNDDVISHGCAHCYARRMANRLRGRCGYPSDDPFRVTLHPDRLAQPLHWRKPRRVFVDSMGDLFHDDVPDEFIAAVFGVMAACPQHTFMVLTKRPERMALWFEWATVDNNENLLEVLAFDLYTHNADEAAVRLGGTFEKGQYDEYGRCEAAPYFDNIKLPGWPLPNVYLGVTAEDQQRADARIPLLLQTPAAVRFVSVEPMLGPVDLHMFVRDPGTGHVPKGPHGREFPINTSCPRPSFYGSEWCGCGLDWIICGAETGPGARPMDPEWARSLLAQCQAAGVPFFFKKAGPRIATPPDLAVRERPEVRDA